MSKLEEMLKYVSEHNEFYKNRIKEYGITNPLDITQWPILTRKELQENRYNMFSDGYKSKYFNQQLRRQSSSGSTGMPINVYWDYKDWYASNMCLWRKRQQWYGIKPNDKYAMFTLNAFGITPEEGKLYYINEPSNVVSFNVSLIRDDSGYDKMVEIINNFQPDWLYIQPFVLNKLILAYTRKGITPHKTIRYIESVGEMLPSDLRRRAEKLFGVKVTNMYGSEEMNGIAIENPNGEMLVLNNNVYLEVKSAYGVKTIGEGEAIVTNLNNAAMPLIRYEQGDIVELNDSNQLLSSIEGRLFDCSFLEDNGITTIALMELMSEINNSFGDVIINYNFVFKQETNQLRCNLAVTSGGLCWADSVINFAKELFNQRFQIECIFNLSNIPLAFGLQKENLLKVEE